jgi:hypothetical protein
MNDMPPDEQLPEMEEVRVPAGCQLDLYAGFGRRMCADSYEEVTTKINEADPSAKVELRVLSGPPTKAEVVRVQIDVAVIGSVLEITEALEDRWKAMEEEQREQQERMAGGVQLVDLSALMGGGGGFRIG